MAAEPSNKLMKNEYKYFKTDTVQDGKVEKLRENVVIEKTRLIVENRDRRYTPRQILLLYTGRRAMRINRIGYCAKSGGTS